jgi:hypothetical protein
VPRSPAWKEAKRRLSAPEASRDAKAHLARSLQRDDSTLVDVVDDLLNRGVVLTGELILALADVDLVYLRLSVLLSAADRVMGPAARRRRRGTRPRP